MNHERPTNWNNQMIRLKIVNIGLSMWFRQTMMLIALCAMATGCQTASHINHVDREDGQQMPTWVRGLQETVQPAPIQPDVTNLIASTPSVWDHAGVESPRGLPEDLTRRLDIKTSTPTSSPGRTSGSKQVGGQPSSGTSKHTVEKDSMSEAVVAPAKPSTLETLYRGRFDRAPNRHLQQFGYSYFRKQAEGDDIGPVPDDYVLGAGDELLISLWGSLTGTHRLTVNHNGEVSIPDVGSVPVAGRKYLELTDIIGSAYGVRFKDFEFSVGLGRLRRIRVHVVGQVDSPGVVEISSRGTVISALASAGGPTRAGSIRRITLNRPGHDPKHYDLYRFLTDGGQLVHESLRDGDVIVVPPIGKTIGIAGYVQRPGIYEMIDDVTVDQAIKLAGGLTPFTFTPHVQLERTVDGRGRQTVDLKLDDTGRGTTMGDGELLLVGAVDTGMQPIVRISGEVVRPGSYEFRKNLKVSDLIKQADGMTVEAYLPQAFISRKVGRLGQIEMVPDRQTDGTTRRVLVIDLRKALADDPAHNLVLSPLDHLKIRSRRDATVTATVTIIGAVQLPGTYELTAGLRASELIALAGNVMPNVYYDQAELVRRAYDTETRQLNIERFRFDLGKALNSPGGTDDPMLDNGDQLVIRSLRSSSIKVFIGGEVRFPGEYVFPAESRITDLIAAAGGVLQHADLHAAVFARESVRKLEQQRFDHLTEYTRQVYESALEKMVQTGRPNEGLAAKLALGQTSDLIGRMNQHQVKGRVVIPFTKSNFPKSEFNLALEDGDRLMIPRRRETVAAIGHVFNPSSFVAEYDMTVQNVLERCGGISEFGDPERVYVIRADGNVQSLKQDKGKDLMSTRLDAGDVVLVPRMPLERTFGAQMADVIAMTRQMAEVSMLLSHLGDGTGELDITAVSQPAPVGVGSGYDDTILKKR